MRAITANSVVLTSPTSPTSTRPHAEGRGRAICLTLGQGRFYLWKCYVLSLNREEIKTAASHICFQPSGGMPASGEMLLSRAAHLTRLELLMYSSGALDRGGGGGSPCHMSNLRKANVLCHLRPCHMSSPMSDRMIIQGYAQNENT